MTRRRRTTAAGVGAFCSAALITAYAMVAAPSIPDDIQDLRSRP
jgi:hypothetical protein